jgi:hypothetical protein
VLFILENLMIIDELKQLTKVVLCYCSDMSNVVSAIDGTLHEIQIPSNEPQQKTYFQQINYFH